MSSPEPQATSPTTPTPNEEAIDAANGSADAFISFGNTVQEIQAQLVTMVNDTETELDAKYASQDAVNRLLLSVTQMITQDDINSLSARISRLEGDMGKTVKKDWLDSLYRPAKHRNKNS